MSREVIISCKIIWTVHAWAMNLLIGIIHMNKHIVHKSPVEKPQYKDIFCWEWEKVNITAHVAGLHKIMVPKPNPSHWCQTWDSHADKSQTTLVTMDRTCWPISKPVTRSMTCEDDEAKAGAGDPVTGGRQDSQVARELCLPIPVHGAASEESSAVENQAAPSILGSALEQSHGDGVICSSATEPMTTSRAQGIHSPIPWQVWVAGFLDAV